jgi:hypothetical protein
MHVSEVTDRYHQLPTNLLPSDSETTTVSVSTAFFPGAQGDPSQCDLIVQSSDDVFFYISSSILHIGTVDALGGLLRLAPPADMEVGKLGSILMVPVRSSVLNVVLHTLHSMSCAGFHPTFEDVNEAIAVLAGYGYTLSAFLCPQMPLYELFLSQAPLRPIDVYATAAHYGLEALAVASSTHLPRSSSNTSRTI